MKDNAGALQMLKTYEGDYPYMYVDSQGYVTVGVGFMIPNATAATFYPFLLNKPRLAQAASHKGTVHARPTLHNPVTPVLLDNKATAKEIRAEWRKIHAKPRNHLAPWYERFTSMTLTNFEIDRILQDKVNRFESRLKSLFSTWDDFPAPAQNALLDMVYNLGSLQAFPTLVTAANNHDWTKCAANSHRMGPSDQRNDETRDRFLEAAKQQKPLVAPAPLHQRAG